MRSENDIFELWKFELATEKILLNSEICSFEGHADWSCMSYTVYSQFEGYQKTIIDQDSLTESNSEFIKVEQPCEIHIVEEPRPNIDKVNVFFPGKNHNEGDAFIKGKCAVLGQLFTATDNPWKFHLELDPKIFSRLEKACDHYLLNPEMYLNFQVTVGIHEVSKRIRGSRQRDLVINKDIIYVESENGLETKKKKGFF